MCDKFRGYWVLLAAAMSSPTERWLSSSGTQEFLFTRTVPEISRNSPQSDRNTNNLHYREFSGTTCPRRATNLPRKEVRNSQSKIYSQDSVAKEKFLITSLDKARNFYFLAGRRNLTNNQNFDFLTLLKQKLQVWAIFIKNTKNFFVLQNFR